jgi:hypothetical protein
MADLTLQPTLRLFNHNLITGKVNLKETPILEWTWKATVLPTGGDLRRKETTDMTAQLYIVWPRHPELVRSRIIGYVWDAMTPATTIVKSQKTRTVTFVVMRSVRGHSPPIAGGSQRCGLIKPITR